ncbi:type II secretion system protein [Chthoniobacter flavus Ellin428]|uniref:Type II secretion system protein n=1 Tax=Chthoniobacter flavus Ellin428 TaxID=497964 RepID=B4D448_9BACT|nr:type II secretion system F family protein [Chthoniobacter flavus]EDY18649.1 type II secretion system protein [Chthoniobacter flavus Ellin428]TCO89112.1 type II secretory pathway component PulF [Chthoniobacter flavus]
MSLSLREKQRLYHSLAQLVRQGIPFPAALNKLAPGARGDTRRLIEAARKSLASGHTVGEAFTAMPSVVSSLESAVVSAVEKSGQLDRGLRDLSEYFAALDKARRDFVMRCAYPVFMLHFGILLLNAPTLFTQSAAAYGRQVGTAFLFVYACVAVIAFAAPLLRDAGAVSAGIDRLLILFPILGQIRRSFALSRFCTVYGLQLDAGINVIDSVITAGRSSRSGLVRSAVDSAVPNIRGGSQVGPLLAASGAFPSDMAQALIVGEETGSLDDELQRLSMEFRDRALVALAAFTEWLPRLIYIGVVLYMGWKIVSFYQGYYGQIEKMLQ